MGQGANHVAASPSGTPGGASSSGGRTPTAHPERYGGQGSSYPSYEARAAAAAAGTPATSVLSTSSFSPPQPLVLLAVRPLGRVSELEGGGSLQMLLAVAPSAAHAVMSLLTQQPSALQSLISSRCPLLLPCCRRAAAGCCAAAPVPLVRGAAPVGRQRSESLGGEQPPSTSRSRPTSAAAGARAAAAPDSSLIQAPRRSQEWAAGREWVALRQLSCCLLLGIDYAPVVSSSRLSNV
jgi:hypothetical protein